MRECLVKSSEVREYANVPLCRPCVMIIAMYDTFSACSREKCLAESTFSDHMNAGDGARGECACCVCEWIHF